MARLVAIALLAYCCLQSGFARADDTAKQLVGSWKLNSWVIQIIGGELTEPFGANPKGRAVFTPDGYVVFVVVAANRKPAANDEELEENKAVLRGIIAYIGTWSVDEASKTLVTNIEASTFPNLNGKAQKRIIISLTADGLKYNNPATSTGMTTEAVWKRASAAATN